MYGDTKEMIDRINSYILKFFHDFSKFIQKNDEKIP
jgi:hypothetical protein